MMNRRRFLGVLAGGLAATAGCASDGSDGAAGAEPAPTSVASSGTVHAGPAFTARAPDPTTDPPSTTAVVVTSTESVTVTPAASDDGGSSGGGAGGGGAPSGPTTPTPTVPPADSGPNSPLRLTLSSVTVRRVVGQLTCTAGPLAWMTVEVGFLRAGELVESKRRRREGPGTGEALAFDVASEAPALDGVRLETAFAYPEP